MKIAYIITSLANSGPIIVVQDLVHLLVEAGHECTVFYFDEKKDLNFPCPTERISFRTKINFKAFDVIHCHGFRPDLFVLLHKPLFCKTKVFSTIHSYMFQDHKFKYGLFKSKIYPRLVFASQLRSDKIIVLSKDALNYYS
ncbi:MAG: glycosyltransferase family 4 protein, partial [Bacteroidaceae bacterium]